MAREPRAGDPGELTRRAPVAITPRPGFQSLRMRAWMATWAAAWETREGAGPFPLGFTWEGARHGVTAGPAERSERDAPGPTYPRGCRGGLRRRPRGPLPSPETSWGWRLEQGGRALPRKVLGSAGHACGVARSTPGLVPRGGRSVAPPRRGGRRSSHTVRALVTGAARRSASGVLRGRARGRLRDDSGFEQGRLGPGGTGLCPGGCAPQALLSGDAAVAPALQDHLRKGRGAQRLTGAGVEGPGGR